MKPHKHSALIKQWADGHKVEILSRVDGGWHEEEYPDWDEDYTYRIKDHGFDRTASHMAGEYVDTAGAKCKWVGLTDVEICAAVGSPIDEVYLVDFRKVIEKVKEKNT